MLSGGWERKKLVRGRIITEKLFQTAMSRKTNRDHAKKKQRPMMEDEAIASQLEALLTPAITSQENYYRQLGMRQRILTLPLMVAAVLTLLWRDVAGVKGGDFYIFNPDASECLISELFANSFREQLFFLFQVQSSETPLTTALQP